MVSQDRLAYGFEVELLSVQIGLGNTYGDGIAQTVAVTIATPDEAEVLVVVLVVVVVETADGYETFAHIFLQLYVQPPFGDARYYTIEYFAEVFGHKLHLFVFDGSAFGRSCQLFHCR